MRGVERATFQNLNRLRSRENPFSSLDKFVNPESIRDFQLSMKTIESDDETWRIVLLS